jgi:hypothetical protein
MHEVEVGTVITAFTVDAALQHICAIFRDQPDRGDIQCRRTDAVRRGQRDVR